MLQFIPAGREMDQARAAKIAGENGVSVLAAQVLLARGLFAKEEIEAFLHPDASRLHDPMLLPDMAAAVSRIHKALETGEQCCIYGDYDADGVCACAILYEYLKEQGMDVRCHIPNRLKEGYGMNAEAVRRLREEGVELIITVDNGISAAEEIALARELGMDVIVTDHHQCPPRLPECTALVNPMRGGYPFPRLCGAGVAFKLVEALAGRERALRALPLAALATVADVVPLLDENRIIAALGVERIGERPGLTALLEVSGSAGKTIDGETLAFRLAPRINAAGRMGDPMRAFRLLLAGDRETAMPLALTLNEENARRQQEERRILAAAGAMLEEGGLARKRAILLAGKDWNPGVVGIVASRLAEEYHRPVILFHEEGGVLTGSGRSVPGINLVDCLHACGGHLIKYGGHAQAAGLSLFAESFPAFAEAMETHLTERIPQSAFAPKAHFEIETPLNGISLRTAQELALLAPFGEGNPEPVFCTRGVRFESVQRMGNGGAHLRAKAAEGSWRQPLVAFGRGNQAEDFSRQGETFDILYTVSGDSYMDVPRLQLMLQGARCRSFFHQEGYLSRHRGKFFDAFHTNILYNEGYPNGDAAACVDLDERIAEALGQGPTGTLVLCCTPQGAMRLRRFLLSRNLDEMMDVRFDDGRPCPKTAYNLALLAPCSRGIRITLALYDRAFLYDCPPDAPQSRVLGGWSKPVCVPSDDADVRDMLQAMPQGREPMIRYYKAFLAALRRCGGAAAREELCRQADPQASPEGAQLALTAFEELGFFLFEERSGLVRAADAPRNRPLEESAVYAFAMREG